MAQRKERLHNFELPNDGLKWGAHKKVRCLKMHSGSPISHGFQAPATPENDRRPPARQELTNNTQLVSPPARDSGHQINQPAPENQLVDIQAAAERMKISLVKDKGKGIVKEVDVKKKKSVATKCWNLRTRRAACGSPQVNGGLSATSGGGSGGGGGAISKVLVPVAKEEMKEDYIAISGAKLPRNPRRRPRAVERRLNYVFPGLWLAHLNPDRYKVEEGPEPGEGLK